MPAYPNENLSVVPEHDPLDVLKSTRVVVEQGEHVSINRQHLAALSTRWIQHNNGQRLSSPQWDNSYHFHDHTERTVNWLLVLDALNFCFWAEQGQPCWTISYHGKVLNGYWAEAATLKRAVEEGIPLWDADYLSTIAPETMTHIFRGHATIPLWEQRVKNAREVGRVLLERYNGQFVHAINQVQGNAIQLVLLLANEFPSFYDVATYRNQPVYFFKRAQICVADLHSAFDGKQWGAFSDLDQLTAFADYKLPQVLRHHHILEYSPTLAQRVDTKKLIAQGSEEEIEIRAATIWACELLRRVLLEQGHAVTASQIDQQLWLEGQNSAEMHPYHRTRTMYY